MEIAARVLVLTVGGALGVNARYWFGLLAGPVAGTRFPWATVMINVSGSFAIGLVAVVLAERWPHPLVRIFALTGILGGYTTFSAYMFESVSLWERGDRALAAANVLGSVVVGLLAVVLGMALGRWLFEPRRDDPKQAADVDRNLGTIEAGMAGSSPARRTPAGLSRRRRPIAPRTGRGSPGRSASGARSRGRRRTRPCATGRGRPSRSSGRSRRSARTSPP